MHKDRQQDLKKAETGAILSIVSYIIVTVLKLIVGNFANSKALIADGLNNSTDIIASIVVFIGLRIARKPADKDHAYGHWKAENVASLITSFIMLLIGLEVLYSSIQAILKNDMHSPDSSAAIVGVVSAVIMYGVYLYNKKLSEKVRSSALLAAAKDNRSDAWTSIGTSIAIFAASFNLGWLDSLTAVVVACLILKTAVDIFRESAFSLSDGFEEDLLAEYSKKVTPSRMKLKRFYMKNFMYLIPIFILNHLNRLVKKTSCFFDLTFVIIIREVILQEKFHQTNK
jgi:cation diffusion facilitator family transporter